jgi:hypothetical protein
MTAGPASHADMNDMAETKIPASDEKPAGVVTATAKRSLNQAFPLGSTDQAHAKMARSPNSAGDDKPDDQTTTTPNHSSNDSSKDSSSDSSSDSPPFEFADQPQSRLLTIPQELRDMIYGYVYEPNPDTQKTETKSMDEEADRKAKVFGPRIGILLEEPAPPNKDAILPCRQLYFEMRKIRVSAYRAYWTNNPFDLISRLGGKSLSGGETSDEDLQRIRHFCISMKGRHLFDLVFELGRWQARVFPFVGKPLESKDFEHDDEMFDRWRSIQEEVEGTVEHLLQFMEQLDDRILDPRAGQGWSHLELRSLDHTVIPEALEEWEGVYKQWCNG